MTDSVDFEGLWGLIEKVRFSMLTVEDGQGRLVSQPMTNVQKDFAGTLWFFASRASLAVSSVRVNPQVNVSYADPEKDIYVSISGTASVDADRERRKELWNVFVQAWFPGGLDDPDLVLLRIDVRTAEYWDVKENKASQLFKMAKAIVTGHRPDDLGEHGKLAVEAARS